MKNETFHAKKGRFLTFYLGEELYGIAIDRIKEIIAMMKVAHVPKTPEYLRGVINLRGLIVPVVDMRLRFGMEYLEPDTYTAIIIVEIESVDIGFMVDRVEEVLLIEDTALSAPPKFGGNIDADFIASVAEVAEGVVMILDVQKLFDAEELVELEQSEH